jgi:hypothetical protein
MSPLLIADTAARFQKVAGFEDVEEHRRGWRNFEEEKENVRR